MWKKELYRLVVESVLIVFSVLFALYINRKTEDAKTNRQKRIALERIHRELLANHQLVSGALKVHRLILVNLNRVLENEADPLARQIMQKEFLDFGLLSGNQSIYPRLPARTSWEAALSTGIITEFDYETVEVLTGVYSSQQTIVGLTLQKIVDDLFDVEAPDRRRKLLKFRLEFSELIGQQETLLVRTAQTLAKLEKQYNLSSSKEERSVKGAP